MKKFLLTALFVAFSAHAEVTTVQASGTGDTCKQALDAAKRSALDKANGSFLHSVERDVNGRYTSYVEEFSGGVIKSYKYLRDDCTFVIIEAQVARRSNIVQFTGVEVKDGQILHLQGIKDSQDEKQRAVRFLDNRREAIYFKTDKVSMEMVEGEPNVDVSIAGEFALKDKWKSDYKDLREMFGWFNLPSFAEDAEVLVTAYDANDKVVFQRKIPRTWRAGGEWNIWRIKTWGVNRTVDVRIHEKDPLKINFRAPFKQIEAVKSFKIEVI